MIIYKTEPYCCYYLFLINRNINLEKFENRNKKFLG